MFTFLASLAPQAGSFDDFLRLLIWLLKLLK